MQPNGAVNAKLNVELLKPYYAREDRPASLDPVCNPDRKKKFEVE